MRLSDAIQRRRPARAGELGPDHPGFSAVQSQIAARGGVRSAGAVLEAARQKASAAAVRNNPRLRRVATPGSHRIRGGYFQ